MINLLIVVELLLMALYTIKYKTKNGRLTIDHVVLLFSGYIFYVYLPFFLFSLEIFQNSGQREAYQNIESLDIEIFFIIFLGIVIVTIMSDFRSRNIKIKPTGLGVPNVTLMKATLLFFLIITLPALYNMIPAFFSKYDSSLWVRGSRGPFLSFIMISITMSSIYLSRQNKFKPLNIFTFVAFFYSLLNLTSGNRGFFIVFVVSIIVIVSQKNYGIKYKNIFIVVFTGVILSGLIAGLRSGHLSFEIDSILYQVMAEGGNVMTSLVLYLGQQNIELIEFPFSLFRQFINIIPSILFPSKFDLLTLDPRVPYYLAASHFYVLLAINFGIIGMYFFMCFFVYILHVLKAKFRFVGFYAALCGYIPFMFFRDFELTIVKFMLEFTVLFSVMLLLITGVVKYSNKRENENE